MITTFASTATSGYLGLAQLHGGRGLILVGILGDITGGPAKLIDPSGDLVFEMTGPDAQLSLKDHAVRVYDLEVVTSPATANWTIFYRLW